MALIAGKKATDNVYSYSDVSNGDVYYKIVAQSAITLREISENLTPIDLLNSLPSEFDTNAPALIIVYNVKGRCIFKEQLDRNQIQFLLSKLRLLLKPGIYLLNATLASGENKSQKIIIL